MTLPYNRQFNKGRQSEQFLNEESHRIFTALKNINYKKEEKENDVYLVTDIIDEEENKEEKVDAKVEKEDISKKTLAELKVIAKEKGIKGYSLMKKEELIKALN